jgi:hypothetical protein
VLGPETFVRAAPVLDALEALAFVAGALELKGFARSVPA